MTVEKNQRNLRENESKDKFPVGMRVLAVDDDPTCLKLLENLLRHCQYHVTITGQAVTALKLLRENRDKFDLVISDVHMPDMDGFKLLELVGLEMDLPVIMLSANSDTKAVMKGISHGACDYLLKPVRIEELKNIWQHVVRRKKFDSKDHRDDNEIHHGTDEGGQRSAAISTTDRKLNRKRKDQNEDDDDEFEENGHENEDPSTQKKPRVVWSVELHRKFVAAVNQLGIDKAVPKRILDLMNVDRLTRENVASHLQKYRLYLKRISCVANQQGNLTAALGGRESSFPPMGSLEGLGDFHASTLASFQLGSVGRLNCPTSMGLRVISPSGMPQLGRIHNSSNSINDLGKLHRFGLSGKQHGNLLHGLPTTLELDQLHQKPPIPYLGEFSGPVDDSPLFSISQNRLAGVGALNGNGVTTGSSSSPFLSAPNNPLMLQVMQQQQAQRRGMGNQSPVTIAEMDPEPFEVNAGVSSHLADHDRCNATWQNAVPLTVYSSNPLPMGVPLKSNDLSSTTLRDNVLLNATPIDCNPFDVSANTIMAAPSHDQVMGRDSNCQGASLVDVNTRRVSGDIDEKSKFSMLGSVGNSVRHSISYGQKQDWRELMQDYAHNSNVLLSSPLSCSVTNHSNMGPTGPNLRQNNAVFNRKVNMISRGHLNSGGPMFMSQCGSGQPAGENPMKLKEEYLLEHARLEGGLNPNSCSPFDDLINTMTKREPDEVTFMDGDIGCDVYPLGTCM